MATGLGLIAVSIYWHETIASAMPPSALSCRRNRPHAVGHKPQERATRLSRRQFLEAATGAASITTLCPSGWAQTYPLRPVRIVAGFSPGSASDIAARLFGQWLSDRLGQQFLVENRPGGGSNVATESVARASPDGYALLLATSANAINATLYDKLGLDFMRDIAPIAGLVRFPNVIVLNPSIPTNTLPEFIAYAKANPNTLNMASAGIGTPPHVAGELFKMMTGIEMIHVPYRGGTPALTDLLAGQVQVHFAPTSSVIEHIRTGRLRAIAVTTSTRQQVLPDVPTVASFVSGYEASTWFGLGAPRNSPAGIVHTLSREINAALNDPGMTARLADLGGVGLPGSPDAFAQLIAEETEKWARVIHVANIKAS